ncbi:10934_t:CDS:2, partial [Funneliformis mosseae]
KRADDVTIHVPGPGPWKKGSVQNVSWWCNECKSSDKVIVEIIEIYDEFELGDTVFSEVRDNPVVGSLFFKIDNNWNTTRYKAFVFLYSDQLQYGVSKEFSIY